MCTLFYKYSSILTSDGSQDKRVHGVAREMDIWVNYRWLSILLRLHEQYVFMFRIAVILLVTFYVLLSRLMQSVIRLRSKSD